MKMLLVQPLFPIPSKSKNHHSSIPIGLLKLAAYYRGQNHSVRLVRGNVKIKNFIPDKILITSLFTYWSGHVRDSVQFYKQQYPKAKTIVGGIYASLMPEHCKEFTGCDDVFVGLHPQAEGCFPAYDLVSKSHSNGFQIIHASRGCIRRCKFCGTWKVEPKFTVKKSIKNEIRTNKLIFYDNNLLANPFIKNILKEITETRIDDKPVICESQSGFDGRLLTAELATMIKRARFINPRIAWDHSYSDWPLIKKQIDTFVAAGYASKDIFVFMVYNFEHAFEEMEKKRLKCKGWGVQIADCRFRPLDQTFDNYNSRAKRQTAEDYYIHPKWTDAQIRKFRRNVRRQNICIRFGIKRYSKSLERPNIK